MGAKQSNQAHDRNNQPGTALYWCPSARSAGSAGRLDRALDGEADSILRRSDFRWGGTLWRGDGLVASTGTRVDCSNKVSAHHFADDTRKRVAKRNDGSVAGIEHWPAPIAVGNSDELHDCIGNSRCVQPADSIRCLERSADV